MNAITLQLARNEQNQIEPQKIKDVDSWHCFFGDRSFVIIS
ncbi:hypothetical protein [Nostoc sp.]